MIHTAGLELIMQEEGFRDTAYRDVAGSSRAKVVMRAWLAWLQTAPSGSFCATHSEQLLCIGQDAHHNYLQAAEASCEAVHVLLTNVCCGHPVALAFELCHC